MLQKVSHENPALMPAQKVMRLATSDVANVLGLDKQIGTLEVGIQADVILVRMNQLHSTCFYSPYVMPIYNASREDVDTLIIIGEILFEYSKNTNSKCSEIN